MPGVNLQAEAGGVSCRFRDAGEFFSLRGFIFSIGIAAGMNFDVRRADRSGRFYLLNIGVDKQRNQNSGVSEAFAGIAHFILLPGDI
ncbi:hypothetical protein D3C72_1827690 [compost metagenome]